MTPDLAIGHALGALLLDMAKGMAAVAVAMACVFLLGLGRGFYCARKSQRRDDWGRCHADKSIWDRGHYKDYLWRGDGIE